MPRRQALAANAEVLPQFATSREFALDCDAADILAPYRKQFELPVHANGQPLIYLCGHSLGLAPRAALDYVSEELAEWAAARSVGSPHRDSPVDRLRAELHQGPAARDRRAGERSRRDELAHREPASDDGLVLPAVGMRDKVLIEAGAFSSDRHAILGQLSWHKLDPEETLIELAPRAGRRDFAHRGHRSGDRRDMATSSRSCCGPACSTAPARRSTAHVSRAPRTRQAPSSASTWRTRSAICRSSCTTGMSTSRSGAHTNI